MYIAYILFFEDFLLRIKKTNLEGSFKLKKRTMNCNDLCNLDDLTKTLTIEYVMPKVHLRKMKLRRIPFKSFIDIKANQCMEEFLKTGNVKKTVADLIEIVKEYKLLYLFRIKNEKWLIEFIEKYLNFIHPNSVVELQPCNKFSSEMNNGVMVVAKQKIEENTRITCTFGVYKDLSIQDEELLTRENLDFSFVMSSRLSSKSRILLGTVAFINHDCKPNCEYVSIKKDVAIIRAVKNIEIGEELLVYYSKDYFGENNKDCECSICYSQKYCKYVQI